MSWGLKIRKTGKNGAGNCGFGQSARYRGVLGTLTWQTQHQELRGSHPAGMTGRERGRDAAGGVWVWNRRNSEGGDTQGHCLHTRPRDAPGSWLQKCHPPPNPQKARNFPKKASRPLPGDLQGPSPGTSRGQSRKEKRWDAGALLGSLPGCRDGSGVSGSLPRSGITAGMSGSLPGSLPGSFPGCWDHSWGVRISPEIPGSPPGSLRMWE